MIDVRKKEKWKVITYVSQEECRVHILLFVVSYLSVNLWIIIVFVLFSTFFSILHYQQMILNRFNNFLLMSSVLFLFFFFTPTYFFCFTILFRLAWIELVDVRKEHFHSCEDFYLSLNRKRYVLKEMRNRNSFVVFLSETIYVSSSMNQMVLLSLFLII